MAYLDFNNFIQGAKAAADMNRADADSAQRRQSQQLIDARAEGEYGLRMSRDVPKAQAEVEAFAGSTAAIAQLAKIRTAIQQATNPDGSRVNEEQAAAIGRQMLQAQLGANNQQSDVAQASYLDALGGVARSLGQTYAAGDPLQQAEFADLGAGRDLRPGVAMALAFNDPTKIAENMQATGHTPTGTPGQGLWKDQNGNVVSQYKVLAYYAALARDKGTNGMPLYEAMRGTEENRQDNIYTADKIRMYDQTPGVMRIPTRTGEGNITVNRAVAEAVAAAQAAGASPAETQAVAQAAATKAVADEAVAAATQKKEGPTAEFDAWRAGRAYNEASDSPYDRLNRALSEGSQDLNRNNTLPWSITQTPTTYAAQANALRDRAQTLQAAQGLPGTVDRALNFATGGYLRDGALANNPEVLAQVEAGVPAMEAEARGLWEKHLQAVTFTQQVEQALKRQQLATRLGLPGVAPLVAPFGLELDQRWLERMRTAGVLAPQGTVDPNYRAPQQ